MKIIAAADRRRGIGYRGGLLAAIPEDHQRFRRRTFGNVVVMGRRTLESLPCGRPLPDRINVVLTADEAYCCQGALIVHSLAEALRLLGQYRDEDIYVIGGESIYRQFLPYVTTVYLTEIDAEYPADRYFPELVPAEWERTQTEERQACGLRYAFCTYQRKEPAVIGRSCPPGIRPRR